MCKDYRVCIRKVDKPHRSHQFSLSLTKINLFMVFRSGAEVPVTGREERRKSENVSGESAASLVAEPDIGV